MSKLSKAQAKAHAQACALLDKPTLSDDEKEFVFRNWQESASHINSAAGAFFTPYDMAFDFALDAAGDRIIDLCAGIGVLSHAIWYRSAWDESRPQITCVEVNADYLAAGQKLVPEATWIHADAMDVLSMGLGQFDVAISNPPFGRIKRSAGAPRYTGAEFEFHIVDIASHLACRGVFILPQMSAGFNFSGRQCYQRQTSGKAVDFQKLTGLHFDAGTGVDTSYYQGSWKGVSPLCEIVCIDFEPDEPPACGVTESGSREADPEPDIRNQLDLFEVAA